MNEKLRSNNAILQHTYYNTELLLGRVDIYFRLAWEAENKTDQQTTRNNSRVLGTSSHSTVPVF